MISIRETVPIKLSGLTSFLVSFDYNPEIVSILKQFQPAVFHKSLVTWEISSVYLTRLLDTLTYYDDIKLELLPDEITEISLPELTPTEVSHFKRKPFDHQVEAINFGLEHEKWLNLSSMGCGKSLEAMYLAEVLYNRGLIQHCLIICGVDSLRSNWKNEIKEFSNMSVVVLGERQTKSGKTVYETIQKRVEQLKKPIEEFFVVVNAATLRDDNVIKAISNGPNKFDLIVVDECHKFATKSSQQGSNLLKLKSKYKIAMTGTPVTNSPVSVYVPLSWTENDHATLTNYKSQYCTFGGFNDSQIIGYKNLDLLQDEIDSCSIRHTLDTVRDDMPKKTIEYETIEMSDEHSKFYDAIKNGVKEEADKIELNANNLLALTTRLRQATAAPSVLTSQQILSSKVERCIEIAEELLAQNEKVMILCNFIETANTINTLLSKYKPALCTGNQAADQIERNVRDFRSTNTCNVLIGTHSKMGTGFSMPECHYMIMVDTPFTAAQQAQSIDRIYRIVSDKPVFIKILLCKDTIDERVRDIVETKQELSDYLVDKVDTDRFTNLLKDIILNL